MKTGKQPHILNAASNLLGICFIIITALKVTKIDQTTYMDEASMISALFFFGSCAFSYISIRSEKITLTSEKIADYLFIVGLFSLFVAMMLFMPNVI